MSVVFEFVVSADEVEDGFIVTDEPWGCEREPMDEADWWIAALRVGREP